jgi:hypothetical protein
MDVDNAWMPKRRRQLRFTDESIPFPIIVAQIRAKLLQYNLTIQNSVLCQKNFRKRPGTDLLRNFKLIERIAYT